MGYLHVHHTPKLTSKKNVLVSGGQLASRPNFVAMSSTTKVSPFTQSISNQNVRETISLLEGKWKRRTPRFESPIRLGVTPKGAVDEASAQVVTKRKQKTATSVTNIPIITASSPEPGEVEYQHPIPCRIQLLIFDFSPRKNSTLQKRNQSNGEQSTMRMLPQKGVRPRSFLAGCYKALNLKLFVIATAHTAQYPLDYWCRIC